MNKIKLSKLNTALEDIYDVFVCSSSFEERCLSVAQKIRKKNFSKVFVIENINGSQALQEKSAQLLSLFPKCSIQVQVDFNDPIMIADKLSSALTRGLSNKRIKVLVDITTFTHETLLILLKILNSKKNIAKTTCVYTNASDYCTEVSLEKKWLSRGCKEVHSILGYPGMLFPSQKSRLIVIVGYEYHRAYEAILTCEPNYLTLVYGIPSNATTEKNREANQLYTGLVKEMAFDYGDIECEQIPCDDPDETAKALCEIYDRHPDENIIVIPMNNKLSTVGLAKSILTNPLVQACYAPAVIYNEDNYSTPGQYCYIFDL